ncbi:aldolase/citrate lyase family protein [Corynebacterium sp. A21]|uniref:aldolase/citrate lyase family protein n=1 Tax=Corynebacterium sp. A21 TaxID=3457318 RepID=UPI003FD0D345
MPFHLELPETFSERVKGAARPQIGMWICSGSPVAAEILAGSGMDWLLIDGEHSPYGLETITDLLHATDAYPATAVVRVPALARASRWGAVPDYLDKAAETISLTIQIESAEAVENAVAIAALDGYPWPADPP